MTSCSTSCVWFAQVHCIAVDCKFHVTAAVFGYEVILCRDDIQQLLCLFHFFLGQIHGLGFYGSGWSHQCAVV